MDDSLVYSDKQASKKARLAAALFFFVCVPLALWDQLYIPGKIYLPEDPAGTARQVLANEFFFRLSIFTRLAGIIAFFMMMFLFYQLFRHNNKQLALLMLLPLIAEITVVFVFQVCNFAALMLLKSNARPGFDLAQQQETAYFLLRIARYGTGAGMGKLFLGLSFIPFGLLLLRSRMIPRYIGFLMMIGGIGYLVDATIHILLPRSAYVAVRSYLMYTTLAYAYVLMWFLIKGIKPRRQMVYDIENIAN